MSKTEVRWNGDIFHRMGEAQAETKKMAHSQQHLTSAFIARVQAASATLYHVITSKPVPFDEGQTCNYLSHCLVQNFGWAIRKDSTNGIWELV